MPDGMTDSRLRAGVLCLFYLGVVDLTLIALSSIGTLPDQSNSPSETLAHSSTSAT